MISFTEMLVVCLSGWLALEAFVLAHESRRGKRDRKRVERIIQRDYPPTF